MIAGTLVLRSHPEPQDIVELPTITSRGSTETAQLLDAWVHQHADHPADLPERPVSAQLTPISTAEFGSLLAAALTLKIQATTDTSLSPRDRWRIDLGYDQRRVEWHERMIAEEVSGPGRTGGTRA